MIPLVLPGWELDFADDFTTLNTADWYVYAGKPGGEPNDEWSLRHVSVRDSVLNLRSSPDNGLWVSGGVSCNISQTYGKWIVKMRSDYAPGISNIGLLWPADNVWNQGPEVDFREGFGNQSVASLHLTGFPQVQRSMPITDLTKWHEIGVEWTPNKLVYTLDGKEWGDVDESPSTPMRLCLQSEYVGGQPPNQSDFQIDYVISYKMA